jgi:6-phosphogluconolactonase
MKELSSGYGRVFIGPKEDCFRTAVFLAEAQRGKNPSAKHFALALSGGSTPKEWYQWCVAKQALSPPLLAATHWFASDERYVRIDSYESNFGTAQTHLLDPLAVPRDRRHPWSVALPPAFAALEYQRLGAPYFPPGRCFDVCFLGMGDDGHTASIFPGSPLLNDDGGQFFAAVNVPEKGWRLTITPAGLRACGLVVVLALGAGKAAMLHRVLAGGHQPAQTPIQLLKGLAQNVVWLVDEPAAEKFLNP